MLFDLIVILTFDANRPMVLNMASFDEIARIAQVARIHALLIHASQLDGTVGVRCAFHV